MGVRRCIKRWGKRSPTVFMCVRISTRGHAPPTPSLSSPRKGDKKGTPSGVGVGISTHRKGGKAVLLSMLIIQVGRRETHHSNRIFFFRREVTTYHTIQSIPFTHRTQESGVWVSGVRNGFGEFFDLVAISLVGLGRTKGGVVVLSVSPLWGQPPYSLRTGGGQSFSPTGWGTTGHSPTDNPASGSSQALAVATRRCGVCLSIPSPRSVFHASRSRV